jgi:3'-5' exoribonuclease
MAKSQPDRSDVVTALEATPSGTCCIADLRPGMPARAVYVVKKKIQRAQPTGGAFLLFQFSDRSGTINGVMWEGTEAVDVAAGDLAYVQGEVQLYQNTRQIKVRRIGRADPAGFDLSEFLPTSPHDSEAAYGRLLDWIDSVREPHLARLYSDLFRDTNIAARFKVTPAGKGWHHAYVGGLLDHVLSMLELGEVMCRQHPKLDRDLLIGGVLLHDVGKIEELSFRSHIEYTTAGRLVGHLVQGCILAAQAMDRIEGFPAELRSRVLHMIVSHHGSLDRGSPKPPMTLEAMAVHLLDQIDSQTQGVAAVLERGAGPDGWSEHVKLLDRFFFRGAAPEGQEPPSV